MGKIWKFKEIIFCRKVEKFSHKKQKYFEFLEKKYVVGQKMEKMKYKQKKENILHVVDVEKIEKMNFLVEKREKIEKIEKI